MVMYRLIVGLCCLIGWGMGWASALAAEDEIVLQRPLPPEVEEIDITYVEQHPPAVTFKGAAVEQPAPSFRPTEPVVDVLQFLGAASPFGDCEVAPTSQAGGLALQLRAPHALGCGVVLPLQRQGKTPDVLSYTALHVRGTTSAPLTLALVDVAAQQRQDNVPLTTLTGDFEVRVPLGPAARRLDLRHVAALVLLPAARDTQVRLTTMRLERPTASRPTTPKRGFWAWNYRQVLAAPQETLQACQRHGCQRILLQMPALDEPEELWQSYRQFLSMAQYQGLEAFALDGSPEAIQAPEALASKVRRLLAPMPHPVLTGVQLDVEPYLLPDFLLDPQGYVKYLAVIEHVREALAGRARLSVVMPFWFTSQWLHGRPVAFAVMDRADEVAVMSYRTALDEVRAIAEDALRYGTMAGVPVWLAVETRPLPVERHVLLRREARRELADAYIDQTGQHLRLQAPPAGAGGTWLRIQQRTTVRPERLTFAAKTRRDVQAAVSRLMDMLPDPSLAGILIHDLDGFLALPE